MNDFELDMDDLIIDEDLIETKVIIENKKIYKKDGRPIEFTEHTTEYYRTLRELKTDPITFENASDGFEFKYQWDAYTGERVCDDPFGSLWFDVDSLIYSIYMKRLTLIWTSTSDENEYYYEGFYDSGIGSGDNMYIVSRGESIHLYPFRLPIIDCYLTKDHDNSVITVGPILTDKEIEQIDELVNKKNTYKQKFGKNKPSLKQMKYLYDQAISKEPNLDKLFKNMNEEEKYLILTDVSKLNEYRYKANTMAVDELKKM